ncbi:MAG TPA: 16S rRNA (uracil(1498)-N(3))-methyltransferase [Rhizomicrobium sp.]|jgi:16S rRNA (uracil1498-N3)-methyltransferase|nr:16S rRNA (uracil(1498)-N(3))-methyltransferase [Rhizomicrobium sp.]
MTEELAEPGGKVRLFVEPSLNAGAIVTPDDGQAHYLLHVMRAKAGDHISLFNGRDGEWLARVDSVSKRALSLVCEKQTGRQIDVPDLWLLFAPIKKTPADYLVQKSTELGVSVLQPVFTRRTIVSRVNMERLRANAIEAAEQSGRVSVPDCREPIDLDKLLAALPKDRKLIFADEVGADANAPGGRVDMMIDALLDMPERAKYAILIGPEGGFDPAERDMIRALPNVVPVALGPRILRADTAALAALAIWQSVWGDWR